MQNDMFGIILGSTWILIMQIGYSQILMLDGLGALGYQGGLTERDRIDNEPDLYVPFSAGRAFFCF